MEWDKEAGSRERHRSSGGEVGILELLELRLRLVGLSEIVKGNRASNLSLPGLDDRAEKRVLTVSGKITASPAGFAWLRNKDGGVLWLALSAESATFGAPAFFDADRVEYKDSAVEFPKEVLESTNGCGPMWKGWEAMRSP